MVALIVLVSGIQGCGTAETDEAAVPSRFLEVSGVPMLTVGEVGSDDPAEHFVDPRNAVLLSDGRVVISEAGFEELRVFDARGRHLTTWGGKGGGPDEFQDLDEVRLLEPDLLAAHDYRRGLVGLDPSDGQRFTLDLETPLRFVAGVLSGGYAVHYLDFAYGGDGEARGRPVHVVIQGSEGDTLGTLGPFPGRRMFRVNRGRGNVVVDVPFSSRLHVAARGDRIALGHSSKSVVSVYTGTLELVSEIELQHAREAVSPRAKEAFLQRLGLKADIPLIEGFEVALENASLPDSVPWFSDLKLSREGSLWVQKHPSPDSKGQDWWVYSSEGRFAGRVSIPDAMWRVQQVEADRVLVKRYGRFDEPLFEVYELVEGAHSRDGVNNRIHD